jgi:hypothetical protein
MELPQWIILFSIVFPIIPGVALLLVIGSIIGIVKFCKRAASTDYDRVDPVEYREELLKKLRDRT